jgi:hypothetical protein
MQREAVPSARRMDANAFDGTSASSPESTARSIQTFSRFLRRAMAPENRSLTALSVSIPAHRSARSCTWPGSSPRSSVARVNRRRRSTYEISAASRSAPS